VVPVHVVDLFESIEVEREHARPRTATTTEGERVFETVEEENPVRNAGQRIVGRGEAQLVALLARIVDEHGEANEGRETSRAVPHQYEVEIWGMSHEVEDPRLTKAQESVLIPRLALRGRPNRPDRNPWA
jgi:hypothetical protein